MKILVTGGSGFIGSHFVRHILTTYPHYEVFNIDLLTYCGNILNNADIENNVNYGFVKGDIGDTNLVQNLLETRQIDAIINFAAQSHVDNSITNPTIFLETNALATLKLLECAKNHGIKRFVQISTDEVYGSLGASGYFNESSPIKPNSPYSASKASGDLMVQAYFETYGLPTLITRCSNNYGPYQYPEKLIPFFINKLLHNQKVPLYGDGLNVRDWLYVLDHCTAIDAVLHKGKVGDVYNIGGNNEKNNKEITNLILQLMHKDDTSIEYVEDRLGHDRRYAIDASKIRNELGWNPKYSFESAIKSTIEWYMSNQTWLKSVQSKR